MYRIKVTRRNGSVVYIKRTWPECFVTSTPDEAFLFYDLDQARAYIEDDEECEIEAV